MRISKKFTAWILVFAIVLAMPAAFAQSDMPSATPVESTGGIPTAYVNKMEILSALDIYSFADRAYNETVTRAEFASMIADLMAMDENASENAPAFGDVTDDTMYAGAIRTLASCGLLNGKGDGNFCPDEGITYFQAIKVIVSALGYGDIAESKGGYSTGYVKCALDIGLIKNSPDDWNAPITFDIAAQLMLQAMETEVLEILSVSEDKIIYDLNSDKLLMNVYHDIYLAEDRMTDNGISAINGKSNLGSGKVKIGSLVLDGATERMRELLGQTVNYYYRDDNGSYTLLYAYATPNKNETVTVWADELLTDDSTFSKNCLVAKIDGKKKKFKIDKYADLLYNGAFDNGFSKDSLKIDQGYITLLDADANGEYELVMVEEYVDIIVAAHSTESKKITSRYADDDYSIIDYENYDCIVFQNADGTEAEAMDVSVNSIVSVFRSEDNSKIRFVCSRKTEEIKVDALYEDDANMVVCYDDKEAALSDGYMKLMTKKPFVCPKPTSGIYYNAYFNFEGQIALLTEIEGYNKYAYVLAIGREKSPLGKSSVVLKIHTEDDVTLVVTAKDKISVDKVPGKSPESLFGDRRFTNTLGEVIPQLVKVTINSQNELSAIEIDTTADSGAFGFDLEKFSLDWSSGDNMWDPYIGMDARSIAGNHIISKDTKIFVVYTTSSLMQTTDETQVQAMDYVDYIAYFARKAWTKGYDADETWELGAAVIGIPPTGYQYRTFTVEKAVYVKDPYGEIKTQVTGWFAGRIMSYFEDEPGIIENAVKLRHPSSDGKLRPGDVLQVGFTADAEIKMARLIYSPLRDNDPDYCFVEGTLANSDTYMLGYLCAAENGRISIFSKANEDYVNTSGVASPTADSFWVNLWRSEGNIMHFDRETKTLTKITHYDVPVTSASLAGNEFTDFDTSVKVLAIRTSGQVYDVLIVE